MAFHAAVEALLRETSEKVILPRYRSLRDDEIISKGADDVVTVADREAEDMLSEGLAKIVPGLAIVGEEAAHADPAVLDGLAGDCWIIDPIDGTKSFIHGVPLYGVLIGVEVRGRPSVGVVYLPASDEMVAAADGLGCTWNGRVARCSTIGKLEEATVLAGSITRAIARSDAYERLASRARLNRGWGDCYGYVLVATGLAIALPPGFEAQVRPRSGLAAKNGVTVLNSPGTIDADYRGEIKAILINHGKEPFTIERGMRIAQMVIARHTTVQWKEVSELSETGRGAGGFGSTGTK